MATPKHFEWDAAKAASNEMKHGVRFERAIAVFLDPDRMDIDVSRSDDAEFRRKVVGLIENRLFAVIYTKRGESCRIISARRANRKEERNYGHRQVHT
jgi:uncharacterized DUF497 family protein